MTGPVEAGTRRRTRRGIAAVVAVVVPMVVAGLVVVVLRHTEVRDRPVAAGQGYWLVGRDGGVFALGDSVFHGSLPRQGVSYDQIVGMAARPEGDGYWAAGADGRVFPYGDAPALSTAGATFNKPIVGIEPTPSGQGYWLVAADGGVFAFGDATFEGSTGGMPLNRDIVGMTSTPSGRGYWLVASDGGVFAFGDAAFRGSAGDLSLNKPIRGIASVPEGQGYWLVASDGGIFAFGDAAFEGSTAGTTLRAEIVGMARTPTGLGYWLVGEDGGVFALGDASFFGSVRDIDLRGPAAGITALDNVRPVLTVEHGPAQDSATTHTMLTYDGSASDAGGVVEQVQVSVDDGPFSTSGLGCPGCGSGSTSWSFDSSELSEGLHTFRFRTVDDMGAVGDVVTRRVTVDRTDPAITLTSGPEEDSLIRETQPILGGGATDQPSGVAEVEVRVDDGPFSTDGMVCSGCPNASVTWAFIPPSPLADGPHTLIFRARDRAGNLSAEVSRTFTVDSTPPVLVSLASRGADPVVVATFSEPVDCTTIAADDFSVTVDGAADPVVAVGCTGPSDATVDLTLTTAPAEAEPVQVAFSGESDDPAGNPSAPTTTETTTVTAHPPVASDDSYSTSEDVQLVVIAGGTGPASIVPAVPSQLALLANDTDVDSDPLTAVKVTDPAHGTVTVGTDGGFTYTPAADYNGPDSFTYKANDGTADSNVATVSITVTAVNDAPVAVADSYATNEDGTLSVTGTSCGECPPAEPLLLADDTDPEGSPLTAVKVTDPAHGTLTLNANGSFTYVPAANYNGTDSFTYKVSDGSAESNVVTVTITVTSMNDAPVAVADSYTASEDSPLVVAVPGVLGNDSDVEGSTLMAVQVSGPSNGTLAINSDGSFTYTPAASFNGTDSFSYWANDGSAYSAVGIVTITVTAANDDPVASNDSYTTNEDDALVATAGPGPAIVPAAPSHPGVLANDTDLDGDTLTAVKVTNPVHGALTLNANGSFTYTPAANYNGSDSFTYKANDGTTDSNVATVAITVAAVNDDPVAADDAYTTNEDTRLVVTPGGPSPVAVPANGGPPPIGPGLLANDTDVDGDTLTAFKVTDPAHGTLTLGTDGGFTYTPVANYKGADSFTYKANDGTADSNVATVALTVTSVNDRPVAVADSYFTQEDAVFTVAFPVVCECPEPLMANDYDPDGDAITAVKVTDPAHGTVTVNANGSFTYTSAANYNGSDSFTYKVTDGTSDSNVVTVTLTVGAMNDAPVAVADSYTGAEDEPLVVAAPGVLTNDTDLESNPLTATKMSNPAHGTVTFNTNGSFTYTPAADYSGPDGFTYRANDGFANSGTVAVSITVTAVNDAPVAVADSYTVVEDTVLTATAGISGADLPPPSPGVLSNDTDVEGNTLTAVKVTDPSHGTVTLGSDGGFTYTPAANYNGSDSFTYKANDGTADSNTVTVSITVTAVNDAPVAVADSYSVEGTFSPPAPGVLSNDTDADGNSLTAVLVTGVSHGSLTLNANGSFSYTPDDGYDGPDSFTYKANDGTADSNTVTVSFTVTGGGGGGGIPGG